MFVVGYMDSNTREVALGLDYFWMFGSVAWLFEVLDVIYKVNIMYNRLVNPILQ